MTWLVISGLVLVLLLQTMRTLSGTHLVLAGVLSLALLWPVSKWFVKGEVAHQTARVVTQKVTEPPPADAHGVQKPSLMCRAWNRLDGQKKNGVIRDRIRQHCDTEVFE